MGLSPSLLGDGLAGRLLVAGCRGASSLPLLSADLPVGPHIFSRRSHVCIWPNVPPAPSLWVAIRSSQAVGEPLSAAGFGGPSCRPSHLIEVFSRLHLAGCAICIIPLIGDPIVTSLPLVSADLPVGPHIFLRYSHVCIWPDMHLASCF